LNSQGENNAARDRKALFRAARQQKARLAEEVIKAVMTTLNYGEDSVSLGIEDVEPEDWAEKVFKPDTWATPRRSASSHNIIHFNSAGLVSQRVDGHRMEGIL
jgi:phenylpyruvate tautomerase PptA (4-oxalocrotonate tautomerase family)